jgi:hypothetical protein
MIDKLKDWIERVLPTSAPVSSETLGGRWRLVSVGGQTPRALRILSLSLNIQESGAFTVETVMADSGDGTAVTTNGQWSNQGSLIRHRTGAGWELSRVRLSNGRLSVNPDFTLVGTDGEPVAAEYER